MRSALIFHSNSTQEYAFNVISKSYKRSSYIKVSGKPNSSMKDLIIPDKDTIIAIGGGKVIDTAKIVAGKNKSIIAMPTTASGASITPYATAWDIGQKISIECAKPILKMPTDLKINLPEQARISTRADAICHAIESYWSKNATPETREYAEQALAVLRCAENDNDLVVGGNLAGEAISRTHSNIIHSMSYPLTILYGVEHGIALAALLPLFLKHIDFKLPKLPELDKVTLEIPEWGIGSIYGIIDSAMKYMGMAYGPVDMTENLLRRILEGVDVK